jgi:PHD/YefM family antitoxin component YafN of YafNO toxin-antitoxin module
MEQVYICIKNRNNIHVNLFTKAEYATYMVELEFHGTNLKMLHNNMQKYKTIRVICRKF